VLLFEEQAKKLGVRPGDAVTVTGASSRGVANTIDCRVVAIARELGLLSRLSVYVSNASLRDLYQLRSDATGTLQIQLKPGYLDGVGPIAERLRRALIDAGYRVMEPDPRSYYEKNDAVTREEWTGQKLDVTTWEDEISFLMWPLRMLTGVSGTLLLVLLVIMVAGIMNTLWIAIRERTREIGTLRAIGMQRIGVARLFLLEAALLGLFGATLGVVLGALLTGIVSEPACSTDCANRVDAQHTSARTRTANTVLRDCGVHAGHERRSAVPLAARSPTQTCRRDGAFRLRARPLGKRRAPRQLELQSATPSLSAAPSPNAVGTAFKARNKRH
jgi:FtsX-like permease family